MATSIAEVMRQHGAPAADFEETLNEIEAVKAVLFAFHPWMPLNNIGGDSFQFGVNLPVLNRLEPIPLISTARPEILGPRRGSFNLSGTSSFVGSDSSLEGSATGFGGAGVTGRGAQVRQFRQKPEDTLRDLLRAFNHFGMTHLASLGAADERELEQSFLLYEAVMGEALSDEEEAAGRRPVGLLLEDFPNWLSQGAPRAVEHAFRHGVTRRVPVVQAGAVVDYEIKKAAAPRGGEEKAVRLISEIRDGVLRAEATAIGPENGILPKTRRLLQVAKNGGAEGKHHFDGQDLWLMAQYRSFPMDTDVERASSAVKDAVETGNQASAETAGAILVLARQMAEQSKRQDRILELLATKQKSGKQAGDGA